jgi:dipeptidase
MLSDRAQNMTGRVHGLVTHIEQVCTSEIIQIWYGLHQLDLLLQCVYKPSLENAFYNTLTAFIGHLRHQQNLISEMRSTCPKVADTCWLSMSSSTTWLCTRRHRIMQHLAERQPNCNPTKTWWIFLHAVSAFATEAKTVFVSL